MRTARWLTHYIAVWLKIHALFMFLFPLLGFCGGVVWTPLVYEFVVETSSEKFV